VSRPATPNTSLPPWPPLIHPIQQRIRVIMGGKCKCGFFYNNADVVSWGISWELSTAGTGPTYFGVLIHVWLGIDSDYNLQ
jgi:hypothetical protein